MKHASKILKTVTIEIQQQIIKEYKKLGVTIKDCAEKFKITSWWVTRILKNNKIPHKPKGSYNTINFTEEEKSKIHELYVNQKRGAKYIANQFGVSDLTISKYLKSNNIKLWSKSDLSKSNRYYYGPTKGFSGKKHKKESKKKISKSLYKNCNRTVTGSKSQFIQTCVGKVQGSYEVAYLQKLFLDNIKLPITANKVKTPYGLYFPDFEYEDKFLEIKSKFTWKVCKGELPNPKGKLDDRQYRKIQWTHENVKPVEIIILDDKIAKQLFLKAIENNELVKENIIYKNGKYFKETNLHVGDGL
jgi:transposase-like protein